MGTETTKLLRWCSTPFVLVVVGVAPLVQGADPATTPSTNALSPPVVLTAQEDHQALKRLLNVTALRAGRNGSNPQATNYANYDESMANPYPVLPDPLVLKNGQKVATAAMWWNQRRAEIVEDFDREIYGRVPKNTPAVKWEVTSTTRETNGTVPVITKQLQGRVDNSSYPHISVNIQVTLATPADAAGPVPVMMQFGFVGGFVRGANRRGVCVQTFLLFSQSLRRIPSASEPQVFLESFQCGRDYIAEACEWNWQVINAANRTQSRTALARRTSGSLSRRMFSLALMGCCSSSFCWRPDYETAQFPAAAPNHAFCDLPFSGSGGRQCKLATVPRTRRPGHQLQLADA